MDSDGEDVDDGADDYGGNMPPLPARAAAIASPRQTEPIPPRATLCSLRLLACFRARDPPPCFLRHGSVLFPGRVRCDDCH